jgi:ABC-type sugar transport system permease subunit
LLLIIEIACGVALGLLIFRYFFDILDVIRVLLALPIMVIILLWAFLTEKHGGIWGYLLLAVIMFLPMYLFDPKVGLFHH